MAIETMHRVSRGFTHGSTKRANISPSFYRCWLRLGSTRKASKTHYDTLRINRNSTEKEIRAAFVNLSKLFHPDAQGTAGDVKQSEQFVRICEAYRVIGKPDSRATYDESLLLRTVRSQVFSGTAGTGVVKTTEPGEHDHRTQAYYGIAGIQRLSNYKMALLLAAIGIMAIVSAYVSLKHSFAVNRQQLDEKSAEATLHHANVRADALKFGNDEQLRRMMSRIQKENR